MLSIYVPHQYRPRIVWLEKNQIKSKALTPDLKNPVGTVKDAEFDRLLDVGLSAYGHFVGLKKGEPARVLKMAEDGTSIKLWGELEKVFFLFVRGLVVQSDIMQVSQAETSEMVFGGGVDKEKRAHIARVFWSRSLRVGRFSVSSPAHLKVTTEGYRGHFLNRNS